MGGICPLCGFNLEADGAVEIGAWRIVPRSGAYYRGRLVIKRASWTTILMTVARERPRAVSAPSLLARFSSSESDNTLASQLSQLKRHLSSLGISCPVARDRSVGGYVWREGEGSC